MLTVGWGHTQAPLAGEGEPAAKVDMSTWIEYQACSRQPPYKAYFIKLISNFEGAEAYVRAQVI